MFVCKCFTSIINLHLETDKLYMSDLKQWAALLQFCLLTMWFRVDGCCPDCIQIIKILFPCSCGLRFTFCKIILTSSANILQSFPGWKECLLPRVYVLILCSWSSFQPCADLWRCSVFLCDQRCFWCVFLYILEWQLFLYLKKKMTKKWRLFNYLFLDYKLPLFCVLWTWQPTQQCTNL